MSVITILVGSLSIGAAGAVGYWMLNTSRRMVKLLDLQTLLRESQSTHFHHLNRATEDVIGEVQSVQSTMNALRSIHPEIDASLAAHTFLLEHEQNPTTVIDAAEVCHVLRLLAQHQTTTSVDIPSLTTSHESMLRRLLAVLDQHGLDMMALHLDADTAHRLGLAALHIQNYEWAERAQRCLSTVTRPRKRARRLGTHRSITGR